MSDQYPQAILERIVEKNPTDTDEQLLETLYETVWDQKAIVKTMVKYWMIKNLRDIRLNEPKDKAARAAECDREAKRMAAVRKAPAVNTVDGPLPLGRTLEFFLGKTDGSEIETVSMAPDAIRWLDQDSRSGDPA